MLTKTKRKTTCLNAIRSQSMASLSQIPVFNFSVCKKGKQKNDTCTLDCNNPKVPLHTKGLYLYKSSENVYNKFNCKTIFTPPLLLPPAPKVGLHAQLINKNKNKFTVASQLLHLMRKGNKTKERGTGGSTVPMLRSPATKFTEYLFNMHKPPVRRKSL